MAAQCDRCNRWVMTIYERWIGGYFGKACWLCFNCLSVSDQEEIERKRLNNV